MGLAFREHNKNYWYYSKVYVLGVTLGLGLGLSPPKQIILLDFKVFCVGEKTLGLGLRAPIPLRCFTI